MFEFFKKIFRRKKEMIKSENIENIGNNSINIQEISLILKDYINSDEYKNKILGNKYYLGEHDILKRKRMGIGANGEQVEVYNIPNNKIIDNQYKKLVKQKVNYILAKPFSIKCENEEYTDKLNKILNNEFLKVLKNIGTDIYNTGIGWLYIYYDENGEIKFKKLDSIECIPVWEDNEHNKLKYLLRQYGIKIFEKGTYKIKNYLEVYTKHGIEYYENNTNNLIFIERKEYLKRDGKAYNWNEIPIVPFRADETEQPLLVRVKRLQDTLNELISDFANAMQETNRNAILILKDYDGENLGEFRQNLNVYGAVKLRNDGDLTKLEITVDSGNYESIVKILKKAIIENGGGFDGKSDTLGNSPNQLNIRSMYSEIDLETNDLETEFQASFKKLLSFIDIHLSNTENRKEVGKVEEVEFILNRDILINESQSIIDLKNSIGIISNKTIIANHPYVTNVEKEIEQIEKEKEEIIKSEGSYGEFGEDNHSSGVDE